MAIDFTLSLVDAYSRNASKRFEGTATTLAQAGTDASGLQAAFLAVSDMGTTMNTFSQSVPEINAAVAGANVDAGATLHLRLDNGKAYAMKIPAIKPALLNGDGTVKTDDAAIIALVAEFEQAGAYRVSEGNYVVSIIGGELDR